MDTKELVQRRSDFLFSGSMMPALIISGIGLVTIIVGSFIAPAEKVWGALLFNVFLIYSIAVGGVVFAAMQDVVGAHFGRPIKRLHEGFAAFIPPATVFFIIFYLALSFDLGNARNVYVWMTDGDLLDHFWGKKSWLLIQPFAWRGIFASLVILGLSQWQLKTSIGRDENYSEEKAQLAKEKLRFWSAPILVGYALCYSLLAFDLLMSLAPTWFSTLWAGWLFAIMMQTLFATLLIVMFVLKGSKIGELINRQQFHDIGKFMHAFTVFFAYLTYAHVLTYWYGNVPEETEYFIHRMHGPWFWIVVIAPFFSFVIPLYTLLFKAAKWTASITIPIASMILIAQWFCYVLIVVPQIDGHHWTYAWIDVGGLLFTAGLAVGCYLKFGQKYPMLACGDPILPEAYSHH